MSVRGRADAALLVVLSILWLPARIVEESLHALAAAPWAEEVSVRFEPRAGAAETVVRYRPETPRWAIRAGYAAPEIVATVAGLALIAWWAVGGAVWWPQTTLDWSLLAIFGAQWLAVALPSRKDMDQTAEDDHV